MNSNRTVMLQHFHVSLALHELRAGSGRPLLLLHALGGRTPDRAPEHVSGWPGPIFGLDFTGHGSSTVPVGGGYSAELLMADADTALAHLGPSTVLGSGIGAYVALMIAGARPQSVRGAILDDGPGITGGPPGPTASILIETVASRRRTPDPWALIELARDPRPADYAISFVRQAVILSGLDSPVAVCAKWRPGWLQAVAEDPATLDVGLGDALDAYASIE